MPSISGALLLLVTALALGGSAVHGQVPPPSLVRRDVLPAAKAVATPADICLANYPGCTACAKNAAGKYVCSVCNRYAPRVTSGYWDRGGYEVLDPYCDGVCMHYKLVGTLLETDNTSPCVNCTDVAGCGACKPGSFGTPDTYATTRFKLPSPPVQCETCGSCAPNRCTANLGCLTCGLDETNKPYPKMKVPAAAAALPDLDTCISDLCVDYDYDYKVGSVDADDRTIYPANINLYSNVLNCKRQANPGVTSRLTIMQCTNQAGCTTCKPGHFRTPNPIVPGTAMCTPCDGCPAAQCGANGCTACPNAVLNRRVAHPWGLTGMNNQPVMVCRNATGGTTPFKTRTSLLPTSVWPAPEFGNCPRGTGDYKITWSGSDLSSNITVAKWSAWDGSAIEFQSNETTRITFDFINEQRMKVTLQYKDRSTQRAVTRVVWGAFPIKQNRICITLDNSVGSSAANANMQMQLYFSTPAAYSKRVQLRMSGQPSLTLPPLRHTYGKVTVYGKRASDPSYKLVASLASGINWRAADWARLVIHPEEREWPALAAQARTL